MIIPYDYTKNFQKILQTYWLFWIKDPLVSQTLQTFLQLCLGVPPLAWCEKTQGETLVKKKFSKNQKFVFFPNSTAGKFSAKKIFSA